MTKLTEWLVAASVVLAIWAAVVTNKIDSQFTRQYMHLIIPSPLIFIILFGLYAATVVLYRVFTFNNCEEAAVELKKEIIHAREDLKKNGYVF
ncbi:Dolichyl-phosphate mannosyltransferase subunit 3 [Carabus blaptoides fortunei]